ncbi:MAG: hypothetical protein J0L65_16840 [Xanthomonadales bacterium]|nr:hypothetical protein [Xanthomonadales bacterium]
MKKSALDYDQQQVAEARARWCVGDVPVARAPRYSLVLPMLALVGLCGLAFVLLLVYVAIFR